MNNSYDEMIKIFPKHVAITMSEKNVSDGRKNHLSKEDVFHSLQFLKAVLEGCLFFKNIRIISVFFLSSEPLKYSNSIEKVRVFLRYLRLHRKIFDKHSIKIKWLGSLKCQDPRFFQEINSLVTMTKMNHRLVLNLAIYYAGRQEIIHSLKNLIGEKSFFSNRKIFRKDIQKALCCNRKDVDLLIITSGNRSIHNFMLWHISYAEIFFENVHWSCFKKKHFIQAVNDYQERSRRFGSV